MFDQLIELTFIPLALLLVQAIKVLFPRVSGYAIPLVVFIAAGLAVLLVDWTQAWQPAVIGLLTYTVQIASGASGVYSWGKKADINIELPDYSDES
jgi:hypothetical protein